MTRQQRKLPLDEWLRAERGKRNLTRLGLAKVLGVSGTAIQNWEGGGAISSRNLEKLSRWSGLEYNDLMAMGGQANFDDDSRPLLARLTAAGRLLSDPELEPYVIGLEAWARTRGRLLDVGS